MSIQRRNLIWVKPKIGKGGMAEVWRVINQGAAGVQNMMVAKRILFGYALDPEFKRMFIDEARITSQLHKPTLHPNIIQVLEFQQLDDQYLLFLEYVNGCDLNKIFCKCAADRVYFPLPYSLHIISEVLNGLYHAHNAKDIDGQDLNIIHRDISPPNILVSYSGEVKIIDWGIANAELKTSKTAIGIIKGKFGWMSPEQAEGDDLDPRTDMFSAGVILWEFLAGRRLFHHKNDIKLLREIQKANIEDPRKYRLNVSENLSAIVLKALSRDKSKRFRDCLEFSEALVQERWKIDPKFSKLKLSDFLRKLFQKEIEEDQAILRNAEKELPSEFPIDEGILNRGTLGDSPASVKQAKVKKDPSYAPVKQVKIKRDPNHLRKQNISDSDWVDAEKNVQERNLFLPESYEKLQKISKSETGKKQVAKTSPDVSMKKPLNGLTSGKGLRAFLDEIRLAPVLLVAMLVTLVILLVSDRIQLKLIDILPIDGIMGLYPRGRCTLIIDSHIEGLTIKIADRTFNKVKSSQFVIKDLPFQKSYLLEISKPGFVPVNEKISIENNEKIFSLKSMLTLRESCHLGKVDHCYLLGLHHEENQLFKKARKAFKRACDFDLMKGCLRLAILNQNEGNLKEAKTYSERACQRGEPGGYVVLGQIELAYGNDKRAKNLFQDACEKNKYDGCFELSFLEFGREKTDDASAVFHKALAGGVKKIFEEACQMHNKRACYNLGRLNERSGNARGAMLVFGKACGYGSMDACFSGGLLEIEAGDRIGGRKLFKKACNRGHADACNGFAQILYDEGNKKLAKKIYRKACDTGSSRACHNLGVIAYLDDRMKSAKNYLRKACERGIPESCNYLGKIERRAGNAREAKVLFQKACDGRIREACENIKAPF